MADLTMIPVQKIFPHPQNPRSDLGDLTELTESIRASGILQNLTVVPLVDVDPDATITEGDDNYTVIIGHRRLAAANLAGLEEVPCVVVSMTENEQIQTMLMENVQRKDLSHYEQAQGFQMMIDLGVTVEVAAQRTGFSESTIRRRLKMAELDKEKLRAVSDRQISLGDFDRLGQIEDLKTRNKVLDSIGTSEFNHQLAVAMRDQATKKNLPDVKKWLKEVKAKKIEQKDTWGSAYDTYDGSPWSIDISKWGEKDNKPPKKTGKPMFYYLSGDTLRLFKKHERPPKEKKTPEELALARSRSAAWKEANEKTGIAYTLRSQFISAVKGTKKNSDSMLWGALAGIVVRVALYDVDRDSIQMALGLETGWFQDRSSKVAQAYRDADLKIAPQLVYAAFNDAEKIGYVTGTPGYEFPKYCPNPVLDLLYDWLISLGYEMSEDEKALRDGSHAIFKQAEAE